MAYTRDQKEKLEVDYPIEKIWAAIPEAVKALQWTIQEKDDQTHTAKLKTKGGFLAYGTTIVVEAAVVDEKQTRLTITAETPVTTITSMADFGRTGDRVDQFVAVLAKLLEPKVEPEKKKKSKKAKADSESANV